MLKLTSAEKAQRREMKMGMSMLGGLVLSFPDYGITVALAPACEGQGKTDFAHVAVA